MVNILFSIDEETDLERGRVKQFLWQDFTALRTCQSDTAE